MTDDDKVYEGKRNSVPFAALVVGLAMVGVLATLLVPAFGRARERARLASCQNNLKQVGLSTKIYANDHMGEFPPLSRVPGRFIPSREQFYPKYLDDPHTLVCPSDLTVPSKNDIAQSDLGRIWDDRSYIYLGYTITDEEEGLAFLEAYEQKVSDAIDAGNLAYDESREEWLLPEEFWPDRLYVGEGRGTGQLPSLLRLDEGVGRFLFTNASAPLTTIAERSTIMIFWERAGTYISDFHHEPRNGNILFADGVVELDSYPSDKFVLSPRFIAEFLQTEARVEALYAEFVAAQDR